MDGRPRLLNLKQLLEYFIRHRREVVTRRTLFELRKARDRAHVLEGLAVALANIDEVIELIKGSLPDHAVVTDGGSAKSCVVTDVAAVWGEVPAWFVPGHPIAGTERSGVEASFAELYRGKRVILTPTASTAADALQRVRAMWEATGAAVNEMDVVHHDEVLAATSHLPHMLAFGLVGLVMFNFLVELFAAMRLARLVYFTVEMGDKLRYAVRPEAMNAFTEPPSPVGRAAQPGPCVVAVQLGLKDMRLHINETAATGSAICLAVA